jgi:predicted transcriptional regulator
MTSAEFRSKRVAAGISQTELAHRVGFERALLCHFELGYETLHASDIDRLNTALDQIIRAKIQVLQELLK